MMENYFIGYYNGLKFALKNIQFKPELGACTASDVEMKVLHSCKDIKKEMELCKKVLHNSKNGVDDNKLVEIDQIKGGE